MIHHKTQRWVTCCLVTVIDAHVDKFPLIVLFTMTRRFESWSDTLWTLLVTIAIKHACPRSFTTQNPLHLLVNEYLSLFIELHVHRATKAAHRKIWCETYKLYIFVFPEIYVGVLLTIIALVTIMSWTSAQPCHSNDLSNISNQKSHLTFCLTHDCWSLSSLTQTFYDEN